MPGNQSDARLKAPAGRPTAGSGIPFLLAYGGTSPKFASPPVFAATDAAVLGRATLGRDACLGASSVVRADGHVVMAGDDFVLGSRSTVHIAHDAYPSIIGDRVTVGANAVVHACTIGNDVVVSDGAVILDGSVVADNVAIEPRTIVFPRSALISGKLYGGMPARPIRDLHPGEIEERAAKLREALVGRDPSPSPGAPGMDPSIFVAATARLRGRIEAAANASIWFGCDLDAADGAIVVGANTNIQDNTMIHVRTGRRFRIGADSTIGHNVTLGDCTIGARSLIGIGSVVANGTIIEDDVFLAAGAETTEDQVLESGFLWGKRPAVRMAPLDAAKRALIALTVEHYCGYARAFATEQRAARPAGA